METTDVVFTSPNLVELVKRQCPVLGPGQLLVESRKTMISTGTECTVFSHRFAAGTHWDNWARYPFYPGYLNAGVVREVAADVTDFAPGDRVASRAGHAQFGLARAASTVKIPDGVSDEDAAWCGLSKIVQNGVRHATPVLGDAVVVIGLGLLGQLVVQFSHCLGAREIIVIDTAKARLDLALSHGATHALEMGAAEARDAVFSQTEGRGADIVYDVTGHPAVFAPALGMARRFGTLLLLGDAGDPSQQCLTSDVITRGVRIIGTHDSNPPAVATDYNYWSHNNITRLFLTLVSRGQMRVNDLITHRYAPKDAPEAYGMLMDRRSEAMGVIFDWSQLT